MNQSVRYAGVLKGIVIENEDPAGLHRVKVRILEIHGTMNKLYGPLRSDTAEKVLWVEDKKLPWAEICYPFGESTPPEVNQVVWVSFYNGNTQYPVVIGWAGYEYTNSEESYVTTV